MFLPQLYAIVIAVALAWWNRIPCEKMINFGASIREEKEFHGLGAVIKFSFAGLVVINTNSGVIDALLLLFILLTEIWVVFDCVLGKLLHDKWFYIGTTSVIDKKLNKVFEEDAGLMKCVICCIVIIILNLYVN